jgi:xylulokinase
MRILSLDVGSSAVKAAILDVERATPIGPIVSVSFDLDHPVPEAAELPPERLWSAFTQASRQATRGQECIEGIGLCCMTPALVLLNGKDKPIAPIWTPHDRRSRPAARQVWAATGEEFLNITGVRPLPGGCSAVMFRQVLTGDPYLYREIKTYLHLSCWLGLKMTGEKRFDPGNASASGLFNTMSDRNWSPRWLELFNLDPAWVPAVVDGGTTIGTLRPAIAGEMGLPPGLPVKLGVPDLSSALLGAQMKPGELLHIAGPTQVLASIVDKPIADARRITRLLGVGDSGLHFTHNPVGSDSLEWLRKLCFLDQSREEFYTNSIEEALRRKTRVTLDPPHLAGDRLEIEAHRAAFRDLMLSSDRVDLLAALLNEMRRQHYKAIEALGASDRFTRIVLTGEGADMVTRLLPECQSCTVESLDELALRGVALLFHPRLV